jgi:hypothetical protein
MHRPQEMLLARRISRRGAEDRIDAAVRADRGYSLTRRFLGRFIGCDRLCRLGRANHQECSRQPWQPPAPIDFRRVSIDHAFISDRVIAAARWLVTFDERDRAAGSMARNRGVVGAAHQAAGPDAGFGHVSAERATGIDKRRQKRDHSNLRLNKGAVPDTGQIVGHCDPGQCAALTTPDYSPSPSPHPDRDRCPSP